MTLTSFHLPAFTPVLIEVYCHFQFIPCWGIKPRALCTINKHIDNWATSCIGVYVCDCLPCMSVWVSATGVQRPTQGGQRGCWIPWNWSYRQLWATQCGYWFLMTQSSLQPTWYLKPVDDSEVCLFCFLIYLALLCWLLAGLMSEAWGWVLF